MESKNWIYLHHCRRGLHKQRVVQVAKEPMDRKFWRFGKIFPENDGAFQRDRGIPKKIRALSDVLQASFSYNF